MAGRLFGIAPHLLRIDGFFHRCFSSTVFVSRLSFYTTEEKLRDSFSPFGNIKTVRLIKDPQTHRPKGFGFVEFHSENDALRALKAMNYKMIDGRLLILEMAKSDNPTT
ncbi:putative RNA binding protein [Zostera marina]|nr:putative RNA binding protein [Zostera marina]